MQAGLIFQLIGAIGFSSVRDSARQCIWKSKYFPANWRHSVVHRTMATLSTNSHSPSKNIEIGLTQPGCLDKSQFNSNLNTVAIEVSPRQCNQLRKLLKTVVLRQQGQKNIITSKNTLDAKTKKPFKCIIIDPSVGCDANNTEEALNKLPLKARIFVKENVLNIVPHNVKVTYENLTADQVLRKILPDDIAVPSSFEAVGHIAHFNLRENQLPFQDIIGQVHLEKSNRQIKTIVNKTGSIASQFRTFPMRVIAGSDKTTVSLSESGAKFHFDYAKVYWNSRLQHEHDFLIDSFKSTDIICDMMCGIGPFAIPAGLKGCKVYANDLNPVSYKYLVENIQINKVEKKVIPFNMCGRDFMRKMMSSGGDGANTDFFCSRIIMNLPDTAISFLDVFRGGWVLNTPPPTVSTYCFSNAISSKEIFAEDIISRIENIIGVSLDKATTSVRDIRDVAPNKHMGCATFVLPLAANVLKKKKDCEDFPITKKARLHSSDE